MAKAAEIAKTDKEWWRHFEQFVYVAPETQKWVGTGGAFVFNVNSKYRLKPRFIDINGHQVTEPVREPLEGDQEYWIADIRYAVSVFNWENNDADNRWLERGIIHLTKEAAEAHSAALLSFTQK
ncbi:hypothetical protein [Morganella morganii]|uniref:hypothetical protein n=1 Tax=Morganella morganii TaxID=582 RepID=UPI0018978ACF|nr:hypothetical protein [Morganella morganii]